MHRNYCNVYFLQGCILAIFEAFFESALLFCGWILLPPVITIFFMNGMILMPAVIQQIYEKLENLKLPAARPQSSLVSSPKSVKLCTVFGVLLQVVGIVLVYVFIGLEIKEKASALSWIILVMTLAVTLSLSAIWTSKIQRLLTIPNLDSISVEYREYAKKTNYDLSARWIASEYTLTLL